MIVKYDKEVSVVFPAYNEEKNIAPCIIAAHAVLSELVRDFELIIVNDGSTDLTADVCLGLSQRFRQVRLITKQKNEGYGRAIWDGFKAAAFGLVSFTDSDRQFDLFYLKDLLEYIDNYDVVIGYRRPRHDRFSRRLYSFIYNLIANCIFGLKVRDINCAFKLFHKRVFGGMDIHSANYVVNAEILAKAKKKGASIKEVPVPHFPRYDGVSKISFIDMPLAIKEIFFLYRELHE